MKTSPKAKALKTSRRAQRMNPVFGTFPDQQLLLSVLAQVLQAGHRQLKPSKKDERVQKRLASTASSVFIGLLEFQTAAAAFLVPTTV